MFPVNEGNQEESLDALFRTYHDACVAPEPGVNFMPLLWQKIEARQKFAFFFRRVARGVVTAALAATLAMTLYLTVPRRAAAALSNGTYVDVLTASNNSDNADLYETVHYEVSSPDEI